MPPRPKCCDCSAQCGSGGGSGPTAAPRTAGKAGAPSPGAGWGFGGFVVENFLAVVCNQCASCHRCDLLHPRSSLNPPHIHTPSPPRPDPTRPRRAQQLPFRSSSLGFTNYSLPSQTSVPISLAPAFLLHDLPHTHTPIHTHTIHQPPIPRVRSHQYCLHPPKHRVPAVRTPAACHCLCMCCFDQFLNDR